VCGHIKRLASPYFWPILKKENKWAVKPIPGPHPKEYSIPLAYILRDLFGYASNMKEVKYILANGWVKRDKKVVRDHRFPIGFMDVLELSKDKFCYRMLPYKGYPLVVAKITEEESYFKACKIINKTSVKGNKIQVTLHDGRNLLIDSSDSNKFKVNDTVVIGLPDQEIKDVIKFEVGKYCLIYRGENAGEHGILKKIEEALPRKNSIITIENEKGFTIKTNIRYGICIGYEKPILKLISSEEDYIKPRIYSKMRFL
jgi:Ribosomal protein S4E